MILLSEYRMTVFLKRNSNFERNHVANNIKYVKILLMHEDVYNIMYIGRKFERLEYCH